MAAVIILFIYLFILIRKTERSALGHLDTPSVVDCISEDALLGRGWPKSTTDRLADDEENAPAELGAEQHGVKKIKSRRAEGSAQINNLQCYN